MKSFDLNVVHQVVFRQSNNKATVSCVCRADEIKHTREKGGGEFYKPMEILQGENTFQTYNRPENHVVVFKEKDKIKT